MGPMVRRPQERRPAGAAGLGISPPAAGWSVLGSMRVVCRRAAPKMHTALWSRLLPPCSAVCRSCRARCQRGASSTCEGCKGPAAASRQCAGGRWRGSLLHQGPSAPNRSFRWGYRGALTGAAPPARERRSVCWERHWQLPPPELLHPTAHCFDTLNSLPAPFSHAECIPCDACLVHLFLPSLGKQ